MAQVPWQSLEQSRAAATNTISALDRMIGLEIMSAPQTSSELSNSLSEQYHLAGITPISTPTVGTVLGNGTLLVSALSLKNNPKNTSVKQKLTKSKCNKSPHGEDSCSDLSDSSESMIKNTRAKKARVHVPLQNISLKTKTKSLRVHKP